MYHRLKISKSARTLIPLAVCAVVAVAAEPHFASALTFPDILNQPKVLGDSTSNLYPYPNASLVKDGSTIYFISGTTKIPFANYKAFTGLGYSLRNVIAGDLSDYGLAQTYVINSASIAHPWGSWLSNKGVIYYAAQVGLIGVPSADIFLSNGGKWNLVIKANKYDLAVLKASGSLGTLTNDDPRVIGQPTLQFGGAGSQNNSTNSGSGSAGSSAATTSTTTVISYAPQIFLPTNVYASTTATFGAISGDPNLPLVYTYFWSDGSPSDSVTANSVVHTYYAAGTYTLGVTVTDSQRNATSSSATVTVILPPNIKLFRAGDFFACRRDSRNQRDRYGQRKRSAKFTFNLYHFLG